MRKTSFTLLALFTVASGLTVQETVRLMFTGRSDGGFIEDVEQLRKMQTAWKTFKEFQNGKHEAYYEPPAPFCSVFLQAYMKVSEIGDVGASVESYCLHYNGELTRDRLVPIPRYQVETFLALSVKLGISELELTQKAADAMHHFKAYIDHITREKSNYSKAEAYYYFFSVDGEAHVMVTIALVA